MCSSQIKIFEIKIKQNENVDYFFKLNSIDIDDNFNFKDPAGAMGKLLKTVYDLQ